VRWNQRRGNADKVIAREDAVMSTSSSCVHPPPHYKVMLAWDPEALPPDQDAGREKYFTINRIQLVTTWSAFVLSARL